MNREAGYRLSPVEGAVCVGGLKRERWSPRGPIYDPACTLPYRKPRHTFIRSYTVIHPVPINLGRII